MAYLQVNKEAIQPHFVHFILLYVVGKLKDRLIISFRIDRGRPRGGLGSTDATGGLYGSRLTLAKNSSTGILIVKRIID